MKRSFVFLMCCISFLPLHSAIHEISNMEEILPYVDAKTWLVFDIDNTLIEAKQMLGSDQWYSHQVMEMQKIPQEQKERRAHELRALFKKVQVIADMQPVEAITPQLLEDLQKRGNTLMALTARYPKTLVSITMKHLKESKIDFKKTAPHQEKIDFYLQDPVKYRSGVLFVGDNNKGKAFVAFLKRSAVKPEKIIFVDDKQKHVENMGQALEELNINYEGFRYSHADEKVNNFDPKIADLQKNFLQQVLSDSDARAILEKDSLTRGGHLN